MSPARVTVITSIYNKGIASKRSTESILNQSFQDWRYVLVNDGSTDETAKILRAFEDRRLDVIEQENSGFTRTFKEQLEKVDSEFIAVHGAGDLSHPERLKKQVAYLDANPDVVAIGCGYYKIDLKDNILATCTGAVSISEAKQIFERGYTVGGNVLMRTEAYIRAGGYRTFFNLAADRDLWLRMVKLGSLVVMPELLYSQVQIPGASVSLCPKQFLRQRLLANFAVWLHANQNVPDEDLPKLFDVFVSEMPEDFAGRIHRDLVNRSFDLLRMHNDWRKAFQLARQSRRFCRGSRRFTYPFDHLIWKLGRLAIAKVRNRGVLRA